MEKALLVCNAGASSGFMAKAIRKAAKKNKIELDVFARTEASLNDYLDDIQYLLIAPHLAYMKNDLVEQVGNKAIKIIDIPQIVYGSLDGAAALKLILESE